MSVYAAPGDDKLPAGYGYWGYFQDEAAANAAHPWSHGHDSPSGAPGRPNGEINLAWTGRDRARALSAVQAALGGIGAAFSGIGGNSAGVNAGLAQQNAGINTQRNIENQIAIEQQQDQAESARNHGSWFKTNAIGRVLSSLLPAAGSLIGGPVGGMIGAGLQSGVSAATGSGGSGSFLSPMVESLMMSNGLKDSGYKAPLEQYLSSRESSRLQSAKVPNWAEFGRGLGGWPTEVSPELEAWYQQNVVPILTGSRGF